MATYTPTTAKGKLDRIERAVQLIEAGSVWTHHRGVYRVFSDRMNNAYTVTPDGCDCFDYTETLKREQPCKHLWAAIGATAALLIHAIRQAQTLDQLEATGKAHAEAMRQLPAAFVNIARAEYRRRFEALTTADNAKAMQRPPVEQPTPPETPKHTPPATPTPTKPTEPKERREEAAAILRKPQPKSVRHEGWEI